MAGVFHGGRLDAAIATYGGTREDWLDLSTGINPNPYPVPELSPDAWSRLPDEAAEQNLLDAARSYYKVPEGFETVAAPGTQAIIELLPRAIDSSEVSIVSPTYGEHENAWRKAGLHPNRTENFNGPSNIHVVVNPNNPTARLWEHSEILEASALCEHLIIDEAFADPVSASSIVPHIKENVIVLRSFGKFFGLAGLRLGFAICARATAEKLRSLIGPWAVSGPALEIGTDAFRNSEWILQAVSRLQIDSESLAKVLENNGFVVEGVNPLFVSTKLGRSQDMFEFLAAKHVLVRPFPDREGYLRFGLCKNSGELERLEKALRAFSNV